MSGDIVITVGESATIDVTEAAGVTVPVTVTGAGPAGADGDPATNIVTSVNGDIGTVVLTAGDVGAQPADSDLTAIAALTTTAFGRALLELADAAAGRTALGLGTAATAASTDFQPIDSDLTAIAALSTTSFGRSVLEAANAAALRTLAGTVIGTDVQAYDAELAAIAGLTSAANKLPYFTGSGTAALADLTAAGRAILDDADAAAQRTTLGLVIGTDVPPVASPTFTGVATAPAFSATGLTGATGGARFVGTVPGAAPTSGTFVAGDYVVDQTLGIMWICTVGGSPGTWVPSAGMVRLATSTLGGTLVAFSSIPSTFSALRIVGSVRSARLSTIDSINVQFNSDANAANYDREQIQATGSTVAATQALGTSRALVVSIPAASAPSNHVGSFVADITGYAASTFKTATSAGFSWEARTGGNIRLWSQGIGWADTTAISGITLASANSANLSGYITLYGVL